MTTYTFSERGSAEAIEEGRALAPKFDADGLVTCVATDAASGDVLMVAHMNAEALARTIESGEAWYFSRSRRALWRKGESSGHVQRVTEMRVDCDQDAVWIKVEQAGPGACHTGRRSCFYRAVPLGKAPDGSLVLEFRDADKAFDPKAVYGDEDRLIERGGNPSRAVNDPHQGKFAAFVECVALRDYFPALRSARMRRAPEAISNQRVTSCHAFLPRSSPPPSWRLRPSPTVRFGGLLRLLRAAAAAAAVRHLLSAAGHSAAVPDLQRDRHGFARPPHRASHAGAL